MVLNRIDQDLGLNPGVVIGSVVGFLRLTFRVLAARQVTTADSFFRFRHELGNDAAGTPALACFPVRIAIEQSKKTSSCLKK